MAKARAEIERALEDGPFCRRLQRHIMLEAAIDDGRTNVMQRELGRLADAVAPTQRAAAQHDCLL